MGRPKGSKRLCEDSSIRVNGFPRELWLQARSSAILGHTSLRKWLIDAVIMKLAAERREREEVGKGR